MVWVISWGKLDARMRSSRPSTLIDWSETFPRLNPNEVSPPASPRVILTLTGQGLLQAGNSWPSQALAIETRQASACSATCLATSGDGASTTKLVVRWDAPARVGSKARAIQAGIRRASADSGR